MSRYIRTATLLIGAAALAHTALAQSTAFTYQGELRQSGQPATGLFDMRFRLYDALTGGSQPGPTQCIDNVTVTAGRFTAVVDLGAQFISTSARYLEVEVRADTGLTCANTTGFAVLSPRQLITPTPRAAAATTANSLAIPNGSSVLVNLDNNGRVGVGTAAPASQLHLSDAQDAMRITAPTPYITLFDTTVGGGNPRTQLQNAGGRFFITSESFLNGTNGGGFTMFNPQGQVGIGTFNPQATLDVAGTIKMAPAIRWKSIHGAAFTPQYLNHPSFGTQGGLNIIDSFGTANSGTIGFSSGNPTYYFASVELPDGALVQDVCLDARDSHTSQDLALSLGKIVLSTGLVVEVATTFTSGASPTFIQHVCNGAVNETIDNQNNVYFLRARMETSGANIHWLLAARIKCSVTSPLP